MLKVLLGTSMLTSPLEKTTAELVRVWGEWLTCSSLHPQGRSLGSFIKLYIALARPCLI
jgi:hypothetical protein